MMRLNVHRFVCQLDALLHTPESDYLVAKGHRVVTDAADLDDPVLSLGTESLTWLAW